LADNPKLGDAEVNGIKRSREIIPVFIRKTVTTEFAATAEFTVWYV
jgi:hypothetical protein